MNIEVLRKVICRDNNQGSLVYADLGMEMLNLSVPTDDDSPWTFHVLTDVRSCTLPGAAGDGGD